MASENISSANRAKSACKSDRLNRKSFSEMPSQKVADRVIDGPSIILEIKIASTPSGESMSQKYFAAFMHESTESKTIVLFSLIFSPDFLSVEYSIHWKPFVTTTIGMLFSSAYDVA